jgi:hypothetical protein
MARARRVADRDHGVFRQADPSLDHPATDPVIAGRTRHFDDGAADASGRVMNSSRLRPRVSSVFAFLTIGLTVAATASGCGGADEEELDQAMSAHHKKNECRDEGYDVKPLGDREKKKLDDYYSGGWRHEKGGMARTKDGRKVMGSPGANNKWIFCVEDGDKTKYQIVDPNDVDKNDVDVALTASTIVPQHNKYNKTCDEARDYERRCAKDRNDKSYETKCALTAGMKWAEADADAEKVCAGN